MPRQTGWSVQYWKIFSAVIEISIVHLLIFLQRITVTRGLGNRATGFIWSGPQQTPAPLPRQLTLLRNSNPTLPEMPPKRINSTAFISEKIVFVPKWGFAVSWSLIHSFFYPNAEYRTATILYIPMVSCSFMRNRKPFLKSIILFSKYHVSFRSLTSSRVRRSLCSRKVCSLNGVLYFSYLSWHHHTICNTIITMHLVESNSLSSKRNRFLQQTMNCKVIASVKANNLTK